MVGSAPRNGRIAFNFGWGRIPAAGPSFSAHWARLEEAIHLPARDVRSDCGSVAEANVHLNFASVLRWWDVGQRFAAC